MLDEEEAGAGSLGLDKGKGRETDEQDNAPPRLISENALHGHELDNLPWSAYAPADLRWS